MNQAASPIPSPAPIAVLSDLHGNLSALAAVRAELERIKPRAVIVLGDLVGYLMRPNQVVAEVRDTGWPTLIGNYDLAVLTGGAKGLKQYLKKGIGPESHKVFAWTNEQVNQASREFLSDLPGQIRMDLGGCQVLACHGSPDHVLHYVHPDHPEDDLGRMLVENQTDVLLMGHTHRPVIRQVGSGLVVNPGSVGKSKDHDPRASFALLHPGPEPRAEIVRVEFDLGAEAELLRERGMAEKVVAKLYQGI